MKSKHRQSPKIQWRVVLIVGCAAVLVALSARLAKQPGTLPTTPGPSQGQAAVELQEVKLISSPRAASVPSASQRIESQARPFSSESATSAIEKSAPAPDSPAFQEAGDQPNLTQSIANLNSASSELTLARRGVLLSLVARELVGRPVSARVALLDELASFRDRNQITVEVTAALFKSDQNAVLEWTANLPDEKLAKSATAEVGRLWGKQDLAGALKWVETLEALELKASATEGVIWSWAQTQPEAAYEWASKTQDETSRDRSFVMIAKMLALHEPDHASHWSAQFPESATRREALTYSVYQWTLKDPARASHWAAQIVDEHVRERALATVAEAWATTNPGLMLQWGASLPDPAFGDKTRLAGERALARKATEH